MSRRAEPLTVDAALRSELIRICGQAAKLGVKLDADDMILAGITPAEATEYGIEVAAALRAARN